MYGPMMKRHGRMIPMTTEKKLRLILFEECNRSCPGCCNNDFDIASLPVASAQDFSDCDELIITGGEPMLRPNLVADVCSLAARVNQMLPIILYTAKSKRPLDLIAMFHWVDGVTLTLHEQYDVEPFIELNEWVKKFDTLDLPILRLNVFKGIDMSGVDTSLWEVKDNIEWIVDCPLPEGETLMRWGG